jgi:hypothetical protein
LAAFAGVVKRAGTTFLHPDGNTHKFLTSMPMPSTPQLPGRPPVKAEAAIQVPSSIDQLPPAGATAGDDGESPVAIIIVHGMGQQLPYQTLASLADRLSGDNQHQDQCVRHVHFVDAARPKRSVFLPRAEITVPDPGNDNHNCKRRQAHIYEVYWAPLTEANISLTDVVRFLGTSGWQALNLRTRVFQRWLFGADRPFRIPDSTPIGLLGILLLVLALVAINTVLTLVVGSSLLQADIFEKVSSPLVGRLSQDLCLLLGFGGAAWLALQFSDASRNKGKRLRALANAAAWGLLVLLSAALIAVAALMVAHYVALRGKPAGESGAAEGGWPQWVVVAVWAATLYASWQLHNFFVQYLGDVAIYIDADKVDKYHKVRQQIRELANRTACAIYAARRPSGADAAPPFLYSRVIVVGHSLGSLIAYDLLNAALVLDESLQQRLDVQARTRALVTFGSPLDKTAYIFHAKQPRNSLRAALRASAQPLTRSIPTREAICWANIYSPADFISGRLQFYDFPYPDPHRPQTWRICNMRDPDACTPATAHTQYWENNLLATTIAQAVFADPTHIKWECILDTKPI